ncbi:MAG: Rne/Rng family ribonuclease [Deltaproteobacteria bacterium]|nr:Rne/Rng family ribonuclease [Deltaproteobacteria bacterium]
MEASILITHRNGETRAAILEDGDLAELYIEREADRGLSGNIYKGRVTRVLPGMQAAFVNIGLERAAFLYVDDIIVPGRPHRATLNAHADDEGQHAHVEQSEGLGSVERTEAPATRESSEGAGIISEGDNRAPVASRISITDLIRPGQEIIVQVAKEPLKNKGARVTTALSIAGRYVVHLPNSDRIGVSRRIEPEAEKRRIKDLLEAHRGENGADRRPSGFIGRTAAATRTDDEILADMRYTERLWHEVRAKSQNLSAPALLRSELSLPLRIARDVLDASHAHVLVDDADVLGEINAVLESRKEETSDVRPTVEYYHEAKPLFEAYHLEQRISEALAPTVALKSGGSIVIDETESMTAIDVNTGRFVGSRDLEATVLKTNIEAAHAIAKEIRLRNLGGIIIIDFIDMQNAASRDQVQRALAAALARDRTKTNVLGMSPIGLVELTRKRIRSPLSRVMMERCPYCDGRGRIRSARSVGHDILRKIEEKSHHTPPDETLIVSSTRRVVAWLADGDSPREGDGPIPALERRLERRILVETDEALHQESFSVTARARGEDPLVKP